MQFFRKQRESDRFLLGCRENLSGNVQLSGEEENNPRRSMEK